MGDDLESPVGLGASLHVRVAVVETEIKSIKQDVGDVKGDIRSIRENQGKTFFAVMTQIVTTLVGFLAAILWWVITHPGGPVAPGHP